MAGYSGRARPQAWRNQRALDPSAIRTGWQRNPNMRFNTGGVTYARRPRSARKVNMKSLALVAGILFSCLFVTTAAVRGVHALITNRPEKPQPVAAPKVEPNNLEILAAQPTVSGQVKILLLGSDQRDGDSSYRTDVILLLLIDGDEKKVSAVSFPRDLWVKVPPNDEMKINQVHALGGFDSTVEMFEANFGLRPDYYILTNFNGFTTFIDSLEGVDVHVAQELTDDCDLPQAVDGDCTVEPGEVHMDGATSLWYIRSRHTSSDLDRLRRAQEVLMAVFNRMMNIQAFKRVPELQDQFADHVETNLSAKKVISLLPIAAHVFRNPESIERFAIGEEQATPFWSWNGMWILLPDEGAISALLAEAGLKR